MVEPPRDLLRAWLTTLGERAGRDRLPAGSVLAAVARACAGSCLVRPGATPLLDGAFGEALPWSEIGPTLPGELLGPDLVGQVAEVLTAPDARRSGGVHYTPARVADRLAAEVVEPALPPTSVCDPAVGGGAFLLAVARRLLGAGVAAGPVMERLAGVDVEPLAVAATESALSLLAAEHGVRAVPSGLAVADALRLPVERFPERPESGYDLVIGNPPFGGQLKGETRRASAEQAAMKARFGTAAGAYTDRSSLFLLLALELVRDGGRVQLILPRSALVARDAGLSRERLLHDASLDSVWVDEEKSFDAAVRVCALTATRGGTSRTTSVSAGANRPAVRVAAPREDEAGSGWGALLAALAGVPAVELAGPTLGSVASATAGFRQQYYGLVPYVRERTEGDGMPLVTSGLIQPAELMWGKASCRFARRRWTAPVVDHDALRADDPQLGEWLEARRRPKLLVASQTRIIEAVADPVGHLVPSVPVVSVEPADPRDLWRVAAALLSPVVSAWMLHHRAGSGLSGDTVRVSARSVTDLPLPTDPQRWDEAAELVEQWHRDPADPEVRRRYATAAAEAYELPEPEVTDLCSWWNGHIERSVGA